MEPTLLTKTPPSRSMNIRAQAVGMCSQMQNVANTIFQQFFPTFLANEGLKCLFFFMAINFVLAVFVYFFIPETKQIALEEIDVLFGGSNHADKGAQMLGVGMGADARGAAGGQDDGKNDEIAVAVQRENKSEVV